MLRAMVLVGLLLASVGAEAADPPGTPFRIGDLAVVNRQGSDLDFWFTLVDEAGKPTKADGEATVSVEEMIAGAACPDKTFPVAESAFKVATMGYNVLAKKALSASGVMPCGPGKKRGLKTVRLDFKLKSGTVLHSHTSLTY